MPVKQRPEWTTVEIAQHVMRSTRLDIDLAEAKKLAARILDDERNSPDPNKTDLEPKKIADEVLRRLNARDR